MTENRQLEMAYEKTRRKTIESEENKKWESECVGFSVALDT